MKVDKVIRRRHSDFNRVPFKLSAAVKVHAAPGCYVLSNFSDEVIYIGQSVNLCRRMQEHLKSSRMTALTRLGYAAWFCYELWGAGQIANVEADMLTAYWRVHRRLPPLNRRLGEGGLFR